MTSRSSNDIIDLCHSGDESGVHPTTANVGTAEHCGGARTRNPSRVSLDRASAQREVQGEDKEPSVRSRKQGTRQRVATSNISNDRDPEKKKKQNIICLDDSDADDSTDAILHNRHGLSLSSSQKQRAKNDNRQSTTARKVSLCRPKTPIPDRLSTALPPDDPSDDDDSVNALLKHGPALSCKKGIPVSSQSHTTPRVVVNPYAKRAPTSCTNFVAGGPPSSILPPRFRVASRNRNDATPFAYPTLLQNSKKYPDLRVKFALALWKYARSLTLHSKDGPKLDQVVTKVVNLSLMRYPLRSLDEYCLRGFSSSGGSVQQDQSKKRTFQEDLNKGCYERLKDIPVDACGDGNYYSIAEATLVAMQDLAHARLGVHRHQRVSSEQLKELRIFLAELIPEVEKRLKRECPGRFERNDKDDLGVSYYSDPNTRSAEYKQIEKLEQAQTTNDRDYLIEKDYKNNNDRKGYIKIRQKGGQVVFELTPLGYLTGRWLQNRVYPAQPGHFRSSHIETIDEVSEEYRDICLAVDFREGGFTKSTLHRMCNKLDMMKVPYFVGPLDIGDYAFFSTKPGDENKLLPILVERKSIQDVAQSHHDGRWASQKQRMYHGQYVFGYDNCKIAFLIEGKVEKQQVSGGYIAHRQFNFSPENFDQAVSGLESEGFDVLRSTCPENSMIKLARWAQRLGEERRSRNLVLHYSYEQFKEQVKAIPRQTDFSRLAKDHMERKMERDHEGKPTAAAVKTTSKGDSKAHPIYIDSDNDGRRRQNIPTGSSRSAQAKSCPSNVDHEQAKSFKTSGMPREGVASVSTNHNDEGLESDSDSSSSGAQLLRKTGRKIARRDRRKAKAKRKRQQKEEHSGQRRKKAKKDFDGGNESAPESHEAWPTEQLKAECKKFGLPQTGSKPALIERLNGPRPPKVWLQRKKKGEYVPARHNVASTALLVALYLRESEQQAKGDEVPGMTKEEIFCSAQSLEISKNDFSGGTTQTGPYHYDGWSSMKYLLHGDPPLVVRKEHGRYKLTSSCPLAGYEFAKAMHEWCHAHNTCPCGRTDPNAI